MTNERIAHYQITRRIGAGAMGEVYQARDTKLNRDVAIKVLPASVSGSRDSLVRFEREARLLASLHHPHIATIFGIEDLEGSKAIVLELVEGETLKERLQRGPLALPEAIDVFRQIAGALEAAHEKGIVHRDLKPANIKFSANGEVKLLDFGIAKAIETAVDGTAGSHGEIDEDAATIPAETTVPGAVLGTPAYMSPEQTRGLPVDRRTDVWAFGCCLYEALSGRKPFEAQTVSDMMAEILKSEPDFTLVPLETPAEILSLLRRCLEKEPRRRLRDLGDIAIRLEETSETTRVPAVRTLSEPERPSQGTSRPLLLTGILILATGLGFLLGMILKPSDTEPDASNSEPGAPGTEGEPGLGSPLRIRSLTILPFKNKTPDSSEQYLGDLIAEEIGLSLNSIRELRIRSGGTLNEQEFEPGKIARDLAVDGVIHGTILKEGNRYLAYATFYTPDGTEHWKLSVHADERFELRNKMALAIAERIEIEVLDEERLKMLSLRDIDLEAYREFRLGLAALELYTPAGIAKGLDHLRNASIIDPDYLEARIWEAPCYWVPTEYGGDTGTPREMFVKPKKILEDVERMDPGASMVLSFGGWIAMAADWDWETAVTKASLALEVNPKEVDALRLRSRFRSYIEGRPDSALDALEKAMALDSRFYLQTELAEIHLWRGDYQRALEQTERNIKKNPDDPAPLLTASVCHRNLGDFEAAAAAATKAIEITEGNNPTADVRLAQAYAAQGQLDLARGLLAGLEEPEPNWYVPSAAIASGYAVLGDAAKAIEWLQKGVDEKEGFSMIKIRSDDWLKLLGAEPGYWDIIDQMRFPPLPIGHPYHERERQLRPWRERRN